MNPLRLLAALALSAAAGCAGYRAGASSLYAPDVATVYVPMVESESFRRDLGERLTEALVKEIELKTPYKVVSTPNADSILEVRLVRERRTVQAEDQFDNPRVFSMLLNAEATWLNRRRLPLGPTRSVPVPADLTGAVGFSQTVPLIPESGQTIASQQQLAIARLAEQIVGAMEEPW
ncbi:LPS assembly lipoprotein LptE [Botrimarina sp.]|uniref:LPS assembly lipoprotein LptE n=1 Tax=Botrimarina sp. TaxID=2795802 RepID=UPI0032EED481